LVERLAPRFARPEAVREFLRDVEIRPGDTATVTLETAGPAPRAFELSSRVARDRQARTIGRLLAVRDVTERIEQQKRVAREAEELARMRDLFERTNQELAEVNEELKKRSGDVELANQELRTLDE